MNKEINLHMITLAREARGLSQLELAEKLNMSPTNLSKIERGDVGVSEDLIDSIAGVTTFPQQFFLQGGEIMPDNLGYRKRQVVAQKLITPITARINIFRKHVQFLTEALMLETPDLPLAQVTETRTPNQIATKLRKRWQMPEGPIANLTQVVEAQNIAIITFPFGTERVDSRSMLTDDKYPILFINASMQGDRQRFSLAHELGHLLMHTFCAVPQDRDIVHEANLFAAELLMPEKDIRPDFKDGITVALLAELKRKWKVSMISLLYRADDLGYVTPNQKRYLLQQFNQMQIRRREPMELDVPIEQPKLVKRWIATYRGKTKFSATEMAAVLCLHKDEYFEMYG